VHIVIGVLSAVAGLIWAMVALQRSGLDLTALNPFLWYRRNQWKKKYADKPIYALDAPMDVAAVLLLGTAKCEGEISTEQKKAIVVIFQNEFHLGRDEASDLLLASAHLIRDEIYLVDNLGKILEKSRPRFTEDQVASVLSLMRRVANLDSAMNQEQRKLVQATEDYLGTASKHQGTWS